MPVNHQLPTANRQLPAAAFALLPLLWLWYVLLNDLHVEWTVNPQYGYGWAVPFLCLFLIARNISRTSTSPTAPSAPTTANCQLSTANLFLAFTFLAFLYAPTRLIQEANPDWRLVSWALAIEVIGLTFCILRLAGGISFSRFQLPPSAFYFPLLFFLVAVPWPTVLEGPLIQALTRMDVAAACELVGWVGIPAVPHGNTIELATGQVGVDDACSGIRSFQATLMISLFLGEFYGLVWRRRLFCVAVGFFFALLLNLLRQVILILVAVTQGVSAIGKWHDPTGVVILLGCFFALWSIGKWLARKNSVPQPASKLPDLQSAPPPSPVLPCECQPPAIPSFSFLLSQFLLCFKREQPNDFTPSSHPLPTASCPLPTFLIPLTLWLLLVEIGVESWYRIHEATLPVSIKWGVNWPTNNPTFHSQPLPPENLRILRFDEGQRVEWQEADHLWQVVFLRWNPGSIAVRLALSHTPTTCLPTAGHQFTEETNQVFLQVHGLSLPFRFYRLDDTPKPVFIAYCLWEDRAVNQNIFVFWVTKSRRLDPVLAGQRNLGQRAIEIGVTGVDNFGAARQLVGDMLEKVISLEK